MDWRRRQSGVGGARGLLPVALDAIIGGDPQRFTPYVDLYRRTHEQRKTPMQPIGVHSPGYVAATDAQAREEFWLPYKGMRDRIGAERGWPPMEKAEFEREIEHGSLYLGSPETVVRKIAATVKALYPEQVKDAGADILLGNLEDAVPADKKIAARVLIRHEAGRLSDWHYDGMPVGASAAENNATLMLDAGPTGYSNTLFGIFIQFKL